jgi:hypothetical protein
MEDQRVPNLEEMDEEQARQVLTQLYSNLSPEEEYNVRHQNYVMEMPQSGERFRWPGGHAGVPESPRQSCHPAAVSPVAPGADQGGTVGCIGGNRLQRRTGIRRGGNQ